MDPSPSSSAQRLVTLGAVLLAFGFGFLAWSQYRLRRGMEDTLHRLQTARRVGEEERSAPGLQASPAMGATPGKGVDHEQAILARYHQNLARERAMEAMRGAKAQMDFMASREMQEQMTGRFRANLPLRYGRFYNASKLDPAQVQSFENAMTDKFHTAADVLIATRLAGASDGEAAELQRQQLAEADAKLRATIGESLHRELLKYELTADSQPLVEAYAGKLLSLGAPLTSEQAGELSRVIAANAKPLREDEWLRSQVFAGKEPRNWTDVDWGGVAEKANTFLSPHQLAILRKLAADVEFRRQVEEQLKKADQEGRKAGAIQRAVP